MQDTAITLGLAADHLVVLQGHWLAEPETADAFSALALRAEAAGFDLRVASGFRDYDRQVRIINDKWTGRRPVLNDSGEPLHRGDFDDIDWLRAILRFSALPGTSRHHWGTDVDIWDAAAVSGDYAPQLLPAEYREGGAFGPLAAWLDALIAADDAEGFFKPYDCDRGGIAPEAWHLSYKPVAQRHERLLSVEVCQPLWHGDPDLFGRQHEPLLMCPVLEVWGEALFAQFVHSV